MAAVVVFDFQKCRNSAVAKVNDNDFRVHTKFLLDI